MVQKSHCHKKGRCCTCYANEGSINRKYNSQDAKTVSILTRLPHPTDKATSYPIHKHENLDNTEPRNYFNTPPHNYYFFYCPNWRTLCPVHMWHIQTQFPTTERLYCSIQSILDKPFFLFGNALILCLLNQPKVMQDGFI